MSNRSAKPYAVLDFRCDLCGEKMDAIVIAKDGTQKRIRKSYHAACWTKEQAKTGVH